MLKFRIFHPILQQLCVQEGIIPISKPLEFEGLKKLDLSIERTNAKGIIAKAGRYGMPFLFASRRVTVKRHRLLKADALYSECVIIILIS